MESTFKKLSDGTIVVTTTFKPSGDLMMQEEALVVGLQEVGRVLMQESLKSLDTDGRPIVVSNARHTSRGEEKKRTRRRLGR